MIVNDGTFARLKETAADAIAERNELREENAKLRKLVRDMGELLDVLSDCDMVCKHYHDGCIGDCYYVNARRGLRVVVPE